MPPVSLSTEQATLLTHASGDLPTLSGKSSLVCCGVTVLFSGSWYQQDFVCVLHKWSLCFPLSWGSSVIKSCWPSKSGSLRILSPFAGSPGWEDVWAQNLHNSEAFLVLFICGSFFGTILQLVGHPHGEYGIWFYHDCAPTISIAVSPFCLFFFCGLKHSPVNGCSTAGCDFGVLTGGMNACPSTPPLWTSLCIFISLYHF